jgi:tRNA A37 threonylcarbamoyladenosine dehydratase
MRINPKFQRLSLIAGVEAMDALARTRVIVFGLGGVGSWCAEALVRSGIGRLALVDSDTVCVTNINRQVQATASAVGRLKADALKERLAEIAPEAEIQSFNRVFSKETAGSFGIGEADYVVDAIDSLAHKLDLIDRVCAEGKPLFSSMGTAQKLDPTQLKTGDIWETEGCPLARLVRSGLRKRGFTGHFTAVYSPERLPLRAELDPLCGTGRCLCPARESCGGEGPVEWCSSKKVINGSAVPVTASAGMILASLVIRDVCARYGSGGTQ